MNHAEQFLSDEEILERVSVLESEGFPPDECIRYAEVLAKYCRGEVAEEAVRSLVENFPDDRLSELVREYVWRGLIPGFDYCEGPHANVLAVELAAPRRGFSPVESGWRVGWPGSDVLEGNNLCRLAILAFWLRQMRRRAEELEA